VQECNHQWFNAQLYDEQKTLDPLKANVQYLFLPQDSSHLYCMQAYRQGVNLSELPENNIDSWLDPKSPYFKPEVAGAVFYYKAWHNKSE